LLDAFVQRRLTTCHARRRNGLLAALRPLLTIGPGHVAMLAALGLATLGVYAIITAKGLDSSFAQKQLMFVPISCIAMLVVALPHYRRFVEWSTPLAIVTLLLLIVVLIPFMPQSIAPVRNGARRWYNLVFVQFQPSELAKVVFVLALAKYLRFRENYRTLRGLLAPLGITFIPMALILVEPDLGTATIFLPVLFAMLLAAGARMAHMIAIVVIGLTTVSSVVVLEVVVFPDQAVLLQPHQKDRIKDAVAALTGDDRHRQSISFQGSTAQRLVGAGGIDGHSATHAFDLVKHNHLPEPHNDMVFAVVTTRFGFLGGAGVLALYLLLFASGLLTAAATKDPFARLVAVGVVTVIFTQVFVNIGMTIRLLPITGMTLPFISYGGSSLIVNFMMIGLILNVASRRPMIVAKPAFEFDPPSGELRSSTVR